MKPIPTAGILKLLPGAAAAALLLGVPAWPQDQSERPPEEQQAPREADAAEPAAGEAAASADGSEAEAEAAEAEGPAVVLDADEESVLDDQTFEGEDEDFIPTEEIPVDTPIPFPTDI